MRVKVNSSLILGQETYFFCLFVFSFVLYLDFHSDNIEYLSFCLTFFAKYITL